MSEYAGRDRYKVLPAVVPTAALVTIQSTDPVPPMVVPLGPEGGGDGDGD